MEYIFLILGEKLVEEENVGLLDIHVWPRCVESIALWCV